MAKFEYKKDKDIFPKSIETERIDFKKMRYGLIEIDEFYRKYSNVTENETQYVTFEPYNNRMEVKEYIDYSIKSFEDGESAVYCMFKKNSDNFIGTASFDPSWDKSIAESGVFIFEEYWGNEYSSERGEAMLELAFKEFDFDYWISKCHPKNQGSIRAIEKYVVKNGGSKVGILPNWLEGMKPLDYDDILYFKLSKNDYLNKSES